MHCLCPMEKNIKNYAIVLLLLLFCLLLLSSSKKSLKHAVAFVVHFQKLAFAYPPRVVSSLFHALTKSLPKRKKTSNKKEVV